MNFGSHRVRRPGRWSTWLAFRSTLTGAVAVGAGWVVKATAMPAIARETGDLDVGGLAGSAGLSVLAPWLPMVGVPGLALGIAAIAIRRLRPVLAILATVASLLAIAAIVGTLVVSILPMYQVPQDLGFQG